MLKTRDEQSAYCALNG